MSASTALYGPSGTLRYHGRPIRYIPIHGVPWFALPDLVEALGYRRAAAEVVNAPRFPAHLRHTCTEDPNDTGPGKPKDVTVLCPTGLWWWTALTEPGAGQHLAAWSRREAMRLCPDASPTNRYMHLTIGPDGSLPPYPTKWSGRHREWTDLRWSTAYLSGPKAHERGRSPGPFRQAA